MFLGGNMGGPGRFLLCFNFFHTFSVSGVVGSESSPLQNLEKLSIRREESAGCAEGAVIRVSASWLIAQMCRFPRSGFIDKFSSEGLSRSWG